MDVNDLPQFSTWFDVLAVTHGKGFPNEDIRTRAKSEYFDVLRPYPMEAVASAYETLRRKMKKWPVPADWLEALPPGGASRQLPVLTTAQAQESDEAEALGYERREPCRCLQCQRDGTTHMFSRYVPRYELGERRHPNRNRTVLLGRWLHGDELRRWYIARAQFHALKETMDAKIAARAKATQTPEQRLARVVKTAHGVVAEVT